MKYLKINKTVLKDSEKYLYKHRVLNDRKYEFIKVNYFGYHRHSYTIPFMLIFQKYMHDDIYIRWDI
jgi:hypothetical protein